MKMTLLGDRELIRKLDSMAKASERNKLVRPAVREAAATISRKAKSLVKSESGLLKKSIGIKTKTKRGNVYAVVGPRTKMGAVVWRSASQYGEGGYVESDPVKYASLVENGSKPGVRVVKKGPLQGKKINHPGTPPQPFLRPAYDSTDAKGIITRRIQHELRKQAQGRAGKVKADKGIVAALRKAGGR